MKVLLCSFILCNVLNTGLLAQSGTALTDEKLLDLYKDLRVADVSDGMDIVGLIDVGLVDQKIVALWRDIDQFDHVFRGIALTARYVPTNKVVPSNLTEKEFKAWESTWYTSVSPEPFIDSIKNGTVIVLDVRGDGDCGSVGSYNALFWKSKGAVGIVSNGGIRDTDELIKQRIPVYLNMENRGRGIRPGRNEIESYNQPVTLGGVLINPGDVIVADGDGVIVVPREHAVQVAKYAQSILDSDKAGRRSLYKQLGIPPDHTVD